MRKITRRSFLTAAVACGAAAALSACGGSSSASSAAASSTVASASVAAASNGEKFTVGICQLCSTLHWMPLHRALRTR